MHGLHATSGSRTADGDAPRWAVAQRHVRERSGPTDRRPQDVQAVHRRRVPALGERPVLPVSAADGSPLANAVRSSRKDVRDAVRAAHGAFLTGREDRDEPRWVLYRVAELMEVGATSSSPRSPRAEGLRDGRASEVVDRAIDRWVWYAGWADKIAQVLRSHEPGGRTVLQFHGPEPTGIVQVVALKASALLELVDRLAPPLVAGNTVVLLTSETRPLPALDRAGPRGPRYVGRARRRRQRADRVQEGAGAGPRRSRRRRRPRCLGCARRPSRRDRAVGRRRHQAPVAPPARGRRCASTGWTTVPRNAPNGSPPSSR